MNLLKLFRKFVKYIRGGASPWQIMASCLLGVALGMTPTFNLTVVLGVGVFLLLNLNLGLLLTGVAVGKAMCLALAPITFQIGFGVIHGSGLAALFAAMAEAPVLAWMDLHNYCFVGGIPFTLAVGGAIGLALGRVITLIRKALAAGGEKSPAFQKLAANGLVRLVLRVLFGKQKSTLAEMLAARAPVFRKAGVLVCAGFVVLLVAFEALFLDSLAAAGLAGALERGVGAEVNVEKVDLSLLGGRFNIEGLQITDPDKPTHNLIQLDTLTSNVSVAGLLARRFVMDEVVIDRLRIDAERASAGRVFVKPHRPDPPVGDKTVSRYFDNGEKILDYLRKVNEYLQRRREARRLDEDGVTPDDLHQLAERQGYLRLSAASVLARRPAVTIRKLTITDIPVGRFDSFRADVRQLSDRPERNETPMTIALSSDRGLDAEVVLDFTRPDAAHALKMVLPNVPIGEGRAVRLAAGNPVKVDRGSVDVDARGAFTLDAVDLNVVLDVHDLAADADGGVWGLNASNTKKVFELVDALEVVLTLEGPPAAPRVRVDRRATLASIRDGKIKALVGNLPVKLPADGGEVKAGQILSAAEKLLAKPKDKSGADAPDEEKKAPAKPEPGDLIKGLLR